MPLQLLCTCGKQLRIPDEHAGRRIMCPKCGASHLVPTSGKGILSDEQTAPSRALFAPPEPWPARAAGPGPATAPKRRVLLWLALFLLLACGCAAAWWFLRRPTAGAKEGDDLALIPGNAQGFVSIRLADLWKSPAAHKARQKIRNGDPNADLAKNFTRETSLHPSDIARLTIVAIDADHQLGWAIVRTVEPCDRGQILSQLSNSEEQTYRGESYFLGDGPDGQKRAIHFVGSHVVTAGSEEGIKRCLDFAAATPVTGPLTPTIVLAGGGHTAVAGFSPAGGPMEKLKSLPFLNSLTEMQLLTAIMNVNEHASLQATAKMPSEEEASRLVQTIKQSRVLVQGLLFAQSLAGGEKGKVSAILQQLLVKTRFAHKGDLATATTTISPETAVELLLNLPSAMKP